MCNGSLQGWLRKADCVNHHQLQAVLFDFDGTLADSYAAIAASVNHVRAYHGLKPLSVVEVRPFVGRGPVYLLENTVGRSAVEADWARYREHHPSVMLAHTHLLPGAVDALQQVKARGLRSGICSNKPRVFTERLLEHLQIASLIDVVVGPEDAAHPKPAPEMLLLALAKLGVAPTAALYVGDMVVDVQTARAAGVRVWVVPTGSDTWQSLEDSRPDRLLLNLAELAEWLSRHQ